LFALSVPKIAHLIIVSDELFFLHDFVEIFRLDLLSLISLDYGILGLTINHKSVDFGGVKWINFDTTGVHSWYIIDGIKGLFILYIFRNRFFI